MLFTVTLIVFEQPELSVTVTVNVPALRPVMFPVVEELLQR
jgi:hypothetical protein